MSTPIADRYETARTLAYMAGYHEIMPSGEWRDEFGRWWVEIAFETPYVGIRMKSYGGTILEAHTRLASEMERILG